MTLNSANLGDACNVLNVNTSGNLNNNNARNGLAVSPISSSVKTNKNSHSEWCFQ